MNGAVPLLALGLGGILAISSRPQGSRTRKNGTTHMEPRFVQIGTMLGDRFHFFVFSHPSWAVLMLLRLVCSVMDVEERSGPCKGGRTHDVGDDTESHSNPLSIETLERVMPRLEVDSFFFFGPVYFPRQPVRLSRASAMHYPWTIGTSRLKLLTVGPIYGVGTTPFPRGPGEVNVLGHGTRTSPIWGIGIFSSGRNSGSHFTVVCLGTR